MLRMNSIHHNIFDPLNHGSFIRHRKKGSTIEQINSDANILNDLIYRDYLERLQAICMSMFKWDNLPDTIDERFLEVTLMLKGHALFFEDEVLGYLTLPSTVGGNFNEYMVPKVRRAFASNGYNKQRTIKNSVLIYNNPQRTGTYTTLAIYAKRLADIDRTIDINLMAQKTPFIIETNDEAKLSANIVAKKINDNVPYIFVDSSVVGTIEGVKAHNITAPYVGAELSQLKYQVWNEVLTFLGVENTNTEKRERLITDEVTSGLGDVEANRFVKLNVRKQAAKQINEMFGLNIEVNYRNTIGALSTGETESEKYNVDYTEVESDG